MTNPSTPTADSAGWIEWKGGECPVERHTLVDVRFADGAARFAVPAWYMSWQKLPGGLSIIAHRLSDRLADERSAREAIKPSDQSAVAGAIESLTTLLREAEGRNPGLALKYAAEEIHTLIADHARLEAERDHYAAQRQVRTTQFRMVCEARDAQALRIKALEDGLSRTLPILSDRAAGGRMVTPQDYASQVYDECRALLGSTEGRDDG